MKKLFKQSLCVLAFVFTLMLAKSNVFADAILVDETNFPDKVLRNAILATEAYVYDDNGDIITDENGNKFYDSTKLTIINCGTDESIKNLDGIELLTDIERFYANLELNSADFSENTKLTMLTLESDNLEALTVANERKIKRLSLSTPVLIIDLSKYKNLTDLCISSDCITSIDMANFPNLSSMYLSLPKMKSIDLSKAKKLENVTFDYCTNLSKIILGKLNHLHYLSVRNSTKLSSLDTKGCSNLRHLGLSYTNFSEVDISMHPQLESIDVEGNKKLSTLDISKNPNLVVINVSNTKIKSIDLKNKKKLRFINYNNSGIKSLPLDSLFNRLTIIYNVKLGSSINLSKYIGKGYKIDKKKSSKDVSFNSKNSVIKTKKGTKAYCSDIYLKKGKKTFKISINYED